MRARTRRAVLAILIALPLAAMADPASAAPVDLTCAFGSSFTAAPGVGLAPSTQAISGTLSMGTALSPALPCSSPLTGTPYTAATAVVTGTGTLGCVVVGNGVSGTLTATATLHWDNGDTSTVSIAAALVPVVPVITVTVTGGALQGSTVVVAAVPSGFSGNCLLAPVTGLSFAGVAGFLHL